jgi:hypothetical protein
VRFASVEDVPLAAASMDLRADFPTAPRYDPDAGSSAMKELRYTLIVDSPAPREDVLRLVRRAEANCHAEQSLREPIPVRPSLRLNGEQINL